MPSPIATVEFLGDGNAIITRANGSESLVPAGEVADVLREEYPPQPET